MSDFTLPQQAKIVQALAPATDAAGRTSQRVSLKNFGRAYAVIQIAQGNAATVALTLRQAQDIAGTGDKALSAGTPIPLWTNLNTATNDDLTRQIDAISFTTDAALANKIVVFEIDPAYLDVEGGFDCVSFTTGASNVANITAGFWVLFDARYQQALIPSAIVN